MAYDMIDLNNNIDIVTLHTLKFCSELELLGVNNYDTYYVP